LTRLAFLFLAALFLIGESARPVWSQQPRIHYVYDDLGRLVGVVDQDGNAATYTYDAVGNILAIGRHNVADTPGAVAITLVVPNKGRVGAPVSIFGRGFSVDPAQNVVSFGGALAGITAATGTSLTTSVPPGALTGPITVTTSLGSATSPEPFRVAGLLSVSPTGAVLVPNATQQFTALEGGNPITDIAWTVNDIPGGDPTFGTISSVGLYTAPAAIHSPPTVTVTATLQDDPTITASATVALLEPQPLLVAAQAVSASVSFPTFFSVSSLVAPAVSVHQGSPTSTLIVAPLVSVLVATSSGSLAPPPMAVVMAGP
jgi:YD repeat-containing protein